MKNKYPEKLHFEIPTKIPRPVKETKQPLRLQNLSDVLKEVRRLEGLARAKKGKLYTIDNIVLKIMEELGELATDLLKLNKFKVSKDKPKDIEQNMKEEVVDGLIMYMTLIDELAISEHELMTIFDKKLKKWEKQHLNTKK